MSAEKIITEWKKGVFKPIYWLEGEEPYFIDQVVNYAEHKILGEAEVGFNLTVFYGKDADWAAVVNACRRYPMFAERQVVILKEAQQMRPESWRTIFIRLTVPASIPDRSNPRRVAATSDLSRDPTVRFTSSIPRQA